MNDKVCELAKNAREKIIFRLGEFKTHRFCDMRIFITEPGEDGGNAKDLIPTKKGLAVSPALWVQFKAALAQVEAAMIKEGWIYQEAWRPTIRRFDRAPSWECGSPNVGL